MPATGTVRTVPAEFSSDEDDALPIPCARRSDNVATDPWTWLIERICRLGPQDLHECYRVLAIAAGC